MYRATICQSSGETTLLTQHLVLVILYGRLSGMQGGMKEDKKKITEHWRKLLNEKFYDI